MSIDSPHPGISRRSFLIKGSLFIASAGGIISCANPLAEKKMEMAGRIAGGNWKAGHLLTEQTRLSPLETERTGIVIVGGGVAGLSAAREIMKKNQQDNFLLLELESNTGGNAASGSNAVSPYPWAAHYIPIPGREAVFVRELFEELGVIEGYNGKGLPVYNEFHLCADPQERLLIHGHWQEGLVPQLGMSDRDKRQYDEFFGAMERFKKARGNDGRRAFAIPVDHSSRDPRFLRYDAVSMSRYLADNGWDSEYLRWYVNYCCRDDYGCRMEETSAWAGIHYFAARDGAAANADSHAVVTWPEGIGWIVKRMEKDIQPHIRCNACVFNIQKLGDELAVDYHDVRRGTTVRIRSKAVIYAAPRFTAFRTISSLRKRLPSYAGSFGYGPWMTANITMQGTPEGKGAPLSWDNVSYHSDSLGYVVANHQDVSVRRKKTVLTYYYPLTSGEPAAERQRALQRTRQEWVELIVHDLSRMHPAMERSIEAVDVWLWGHAMIRPIPGLIWGAARQEAMKPIGKIFFAHSDMSGLSIFEEAQYRGIMAARQALKTTAAV